MRFIVLGTSEFALSGARALLDSGGEVSALCSMPPQALPNNSVEVGSFARTNKLAYHEFEDINSSEATGILREHRPDYILCSWPRILSRKTLQIPRRYCIGTHPTELPFNRGRHPLHWLIALGVTDTKLSFFRMEERVDRGSVLLQVPFRITKDDFIGDAVSKMNTAAYEGTKRLYAMLVADPSYTGTEQNHAVANSWRMRTPHDVTLDIRMSADAILRTVRSFAPPYPCSKLLFENERLLVLNASVASVTLEMTPDQLRRIEPGRIISVEATNIRVKVDDAIMDLEIRPPVPPSLLKARYIHPPSKYMAEWHDLLSA